MQAPEGNRDDAPAPPGLLSRFVDFLVRRRNLLLCAGVVLTVLSIAPSRRLTFDRSIESLYAPGNPRLEDYVDSKTMFGGDEFVFVTYADPELFSEAGQKRLKDLAGQLADVPGVEPNSVQSLADILATLRLPFLGKRRSQLLEFCRGVLLGDDDATTAVMLRLSDDPASRDTSIAALRRMAAAQPSPTYVVGEPVLVHDMFQYAQDDGEWMGWASSGLLALVILFFLRDARSIVLPFAIVQMTIVATKAILALSRLQLSMVSSILSSLVTIIGVSTVVYLSLYYRRLREELNGEAALRRMLNVLGVDVFWVCVTTAVGFSAQLSSSIHPVRSFGLTMVIGAMMVFFSMLLLLPGGMLLGGEASAPRKPRGEAQLGRSLSGLTEWVLRHPWGVGLTCVVLVAVSIAGLFRLRVETDFTKNFRASSPVVQSLDFLESRLGGAGLWEVNFPAPEELGEEYLQKVRRLTQSLRDIEIGGRKGLTKVLALSDGIDVVPRIPLLVPGLAAQTRILGKAQPEFIPSVYNPEAGRMRIMLRAREKEPSEQKQLLIARVGEIARSEFPEAKVTGLYVMLTYLITSLLQDQWLDLALGAAGLVGAMAIAYRSLGLGIISLLPNVLPIVLLLGSMGWLNVPINIGTAMISSDAMGLTVHDSIFYLSAFLRERRSGLDFLSALRAVQTEVRRPLVYSNLALILGFLVLTTSHFVPLVYFGLLVSVAIAGGLAVNLLLLPVLLRGWR